MPIDILKTFDFCHILKPRGLSELFTPPVEQETAKKWLEGEEALPTWAEAWLYQWSLKFSKHHNDLLMKLRNQTEEKIYYIHYNCGTLSSQTFEKLQQGDSHFFSCMGLYFYCYQEFQSLLKIAGLTDYLVIVPMYEPDYKNWLKEQSQKHSRNNLLHWAEEQNQKHGSRLTHPEWDKRVHWEKEVLPLVFESYQKAIDDYIERQKSSPEGDNLVSEQIPESDLKLYQENQTLSLEENEPTQLSFRKHQSYFKGIKGFFRWKTCLLRMDGLFLWMSIKYSKINAQKGINYFKVYQGQDSSFSVPSLRSQSDNEQNRIQDNQLLKKEERIRKHLYKLDKRNVILPQNQELVSKEQGQKSKDINWNKIDLFLKDGAIIYATPSEQVSLYAGIYWSKPQTLAQLKILIKALKEHPNFQFFPQEANKNDLKQNILSQQIILGTGIGWLKKQLPRQKQDLSQLKQAIRTYQQKSDFKPFKSESFPKLEHSRGLIKHLEKRLGELNN